MLPRLALVALAVLLAAGCGASPPMFIVQHTDYGTCARPGADSCVVTAVIQNLGGDGSGTATAGLWQDPDSVELAKCQVPIPKTATNEVVTVSCTLSNLSGVWAGVAGLDEGYLIQFGVVAH